MSIAPGAKQPKQDRSRASLERLMAASRELLRDGTFEQLTIGAISKLSGVSVGSIYARFQGKDDLFLAVMTNVLAEIDAEWATLLSAIRARELPLDKRVPAVVEMLAEHLKTHANLLRPLMGRASDKHVANCGKASYLKAAHGFQSLLLECCADIRHPNPPHAVEACFSITYAALARFLGLGSAAEASGEGDWEQLKKDLGIMCRGFLCLEMDHS
ncbi:TetR/AcrR family transcriptional regulator [Pseudomonas sp. NPDC012596]|uniref:TetR/AcrR family transcriptional regulator n=1 Tax=Pseudomonas sp. NPDC012596 TaxID=3364419 RepID=UPI003687C71A